MNSPQRKKDRERLACLLERRCFELNETNRNPRPETIQQITTSADVSGGTLARLLLFAGLHCSVSICCLLSVLSGCALALALSYVLSLALIPITFLAGCLLPLLAIDRRAEIRANAFAADYPSVLLATASSLQAGSTPLMALEFATGLLPEGSPVRQETSTLLSALRDGVSKSVALHNFGSSYRLPDLELFRSAFAIALDHGGRFTPTLQRLAAVSRDRSTLIHTARVSTTTMRMTANILLAVAPLLLFLIGMRTENFLETLMYHETANIIASFGVVMIALSYATLRTMSNFRP